MEYLEGVALTDLKAVRSITNAQPDEVLVNALNTWFLSLTMCPTFHADVHAGNFFSSGFETHIPDVHSFILEPRLEGTMKFCLQSINFADIFWD